MKRDNYFEVVNLLNELILDRITQLLYQLYQLFRLYQQCLQKCSFV